MSAPTRFVHDGRTRARSTPEFLAARERLADEVRREFAAELARRRGLGRILVRWRMQRELRRRIERLAPRDACYLIADQRGE